MKIKLMTKGLGVLALAGWTLASVAARADYGAWDHPERFHDGMTMGRPQVASGWEIDARQARQHDRIRQGLRTGALCPDEARALRREQRRIRHLEREFRADGHLSRAEYRVLDRRLDAASRNIHAEKHDGRWR